MIHFSIGKELGKLQHLNMRTSKLSQKVIASVRQSDVVSDISELTPSVINEMEKLRRLEVNKIKRNKLGLFSKESEQG